jgi:hypothetical protein
MKAKILMVAAAFGLLCPLASHAVWKNYDPEVDVFTDSLNPLALPKKFSATGFYTDWAKKTVTAEANYYEVNSALWSDGATKSRWLILPASTKVIFNENSDYWNYPNGATFIKLFTHQTVPGDTSAANRIWWETRVLINKESGGSDTWYGFSYKWVNNGSEAYLLPPDGMVQDSARKVTFTIYPNGKTAAGKIKKWAYPKREDCNTCHLGSEGTSGRPVLGFYTAQINRPSKANANLNQIEDFFQKNLLQWENKGTAKPTAAEIKAFPRYYGLADADTAATLNKRARSYLAANCSGCHGARSLENFTTTTIDFDFFDLKPHMKFAYRVTSKDPDVGPGAALLVPKRPDLSVLLFRQKARRTYELDVQQHAADPLSDLPNFSADPLQMPTLATFEEDTAATKVFSQWITGFDTTGQVDPDWPGVGIRSVGRKYALQAPSILGNHVLIPSTLSGRVALVSVAGREWVLNAEVAGVYTLPDALQPGIYFIRVGDKSFQQYVF